MSSAEGGSAEGGDEAAGSSGGGGSEEVLHLSLSRPFVLTADRIALFVEALREALRWRRPFGAAVRALPAGCAAAALLLSNDERSRTFIALPVDSAGGGATAAAARGGRGGGGGGGAGGGGLLHGLVRSVDSVLSRADVGQRARVYYTAPQFHLTVASLLGDELFQAAAAPAAAAASAAAAGAAAAAAAAGGGRSGAAGAAAFQGVGATGGCGDEVVGRGKLGPVLVGDDGGGLRRTARRLCEEDGEKDSGSAGAALPFAVSEVVCKIGYKEFVIPIGNR